MVLVINQVVWKWMVIFFYILQSPFSSSPLPSLPFRFLLFVDMSSISDIDAPLLSSLSSLPPPPPLPLSADLLSEVIEMFGLSDVPEVTDVSEVPDVPEVSELPEVPEAADVSELPEVTELLDLPEVPEESIIPPDLSPSPRSKRRRTEPDAAVQLSIPSSVMSILVTDLVKNMERKIATLIVKVRVQQDLIINLQGLLTEKTRTVENQAASLSKRKTTEAHCLSELGKITSQLNEEISRSKELTAKVIHGENLVRVYATEIEDLKLQNHQQVSLANTREISWADQRLQQDKMMRALEDHLTQQAKFLDQLETEKCSLQSQLTDQIDETATLKQQLETSQQQHLSRIATLEQQLEQQLETSQQQHLSRIATLEQQLETSQQQLKTNQQQHLSRIATLEQQLETSQQLLENNEELPRLRALVDEMKQQLALKDKTLLQQEALLSQRANEVNDLQKALNTTIQQTGDEIGTLRSDIQFKIQQIALHNQNWTKLRERVNQQTDQLQSVEAKHKVLETKYNQQTGQLHSLEAKHKVLETKYKQQAVQLQSVEAKHKVLETKYNKVIRLYYEKSTAINTFLVCATQSSRNLGERDDVDDAVEGDINRETLRLDSHTAATFNGKETASEDTGTMESKINEHPSRPSSLAPTTRRGRSQKRSMQ